MENNKTPSRVMDIQRRPSPSPAPLASRSVANKQTATSRKPTETMRSQPAQVSHDNNHSPQVAVAEEPTLPIGVITVTVFVLLVLIAVGWMAFSVAA